MEDNTGEILREIILALHDVIKKLDSFKIESKRRVKYLLNKDKSGKIKSFFPNMNPRDYSRFFSSRSYGDLLIVADYDHPGFEDFYNKPENKKKIDALFYNNKNFAKLISVGKDNEKLPRSLLLDVDNNINLYFKLIFKIKHLKPKNFNYKPKENFFKCFPEHPEYKDILSSALDMYHELHLIRNCIVHHGATVNEELAKNLNLVIRNKSDLQKVHINPDGLRYYVLMVFKIICNTVRDVFPNFPLEDVYDDCNKVMQDLKKYDKKMHPRGWFLNCKK